MSERVLWYAAGAVCCFLAASTGVAGVAAVLDGADPIGFVMLFVVLLGAGFGAISIAHEEG